MLTVRIFSSGSSLSLLIVSFGSKSKLCTLSVSLLVDFRKDIFFKVCLLFFSIVSVQTQRKIAFSYSGMQIILCKFFLSCKRSTLQIATI